MDEGRQVMAIPHMTLWIRWAKNETESTDEESTSSETTVVPQVPTSNSFLPLSDAKENTKEETNLKKTERVNEIEEINIIIDSHGNGISAKKYTEIKRLR